ncbi:MAG: hypothetical protein EBY39_12020, partial [Flavobacteriia bacterium]|nr:hypothetical protein [Flavobacteriia bacterium]
MAFTKLNRNNFTRTKITNKSFVKYRASDEVNLQKDFSLNSKNIVNTEFTVDLNILDKAIEKYNSGVDDDADKISPDSTVKNILLAAINEQIQKLKQRKNLKLEDVEPDEPDGFYDKLRTITGINTQPDLSNFNNAGSISAPKFFKFVLSELFVSNEFKIKRVGQKFLPYSDELSKKNFIRDKLYRYYRDQIADADHKNVSYTFTNYNTLNFHQIGDDKHANAVVYPNPYSNSKHGYEFLDSNNFNISFWINKRQTNNEDEAQCLLHIPYFLSLYTVDKSSTGYSFLIRCGDNANSYFDSSRVLGLADTDDVENLANANNLTKVQFGNGKLLTNHWHNISINFLNSESSGMLILFYIDGQFVGRNLLNNGNSSINPKSGHSLVCLGNKPRYEEATNETLDSLYTQFFAKIKNGDDDAYGPFYNKDIS